MLRLLISVILFPGVAFAQTTLKGADGSFVPMPGVEYFCTDTNGDRRELGEVTCITAGSCLQMIARCDMSANSPMWRKIQEGCPAAAASTSILDRLNAVKPARNTVAIDPVI